MNLLHKFLIILFIFLLLYLPLNSSSILRFNDQDYPDVNIKYTDCSKYKKILDAEKGKGVATVPLMYFKKVIIDKMVNNKKGWSYEDARRGKDKGYESYYINFQRAFSTSLLTVTGVLYKYKYKGKILYKTLLYMERPQRPDSHLTGGTVEFYVDVKNNIMVLYAEHDGLKYFVFGYISKWKSNDKKLF